MVSEKQIEAAAKAMETLALERGFVPWDEAASVALTAAEQAEPAPAAEPVACVERGSEQSTPQPESRLREARLREAAREAVNCITHHAEDNENTRWVLSLLNAALKEASE